MPTYGTTPATAQAINVQLTAATSYFYQFYNSGDMTHALGQADLINCYRSQLGMDPFIPWAGYTPRTDCQNVTPLVLSGPIPSSGTGSSSTGSSGSGNNTAHDTGGVTVTNDKPNAYYGPSGTCEDSSDPYCCYYPTDPTCCEGDPGCTPGGSGGGSGPVNITNITNIVGEDATTVWSQITGALSSLWSIVVGVFDAAIAGAIAAIQAALTAIANALKQAFEVLAHLVGDVLAFLGTVLKRLLAAIVDVLKRLRQLIKDIFNDIILPAIQALQKIRKWLIDLYEKFVRPILLWIQYLRQWLALLKLLHIKWAAKLDQTLAELEAKVTAPLYFLLSFTNGIANWLNLIVTAGYLFQRPIWLASLNAYKGASVALVANSMNTPGSIAAAGAGAAGSGLPTTTSSDQAGLQYMKDGTGAYQPLIDQQTDAFQQYLSGGL